MPVSAQPMAGAHQPGRATCHHCTARGRAFCRAVDSDHLDRLAEIVSHVEIDADRSLFYEGDDAVHVFSVRSGMVKLYKLLSDGRRQITGFLVPGDYLGLAYGQRYVYGAEAVVPSSLCRFERRRLQRLIDRQPAIERELLERAANELAVAQDQMLLLGRKSALERLASFLVMMARRAGGCPELAPQVALPMGRADIADYLGLTIETVSRSFSALRKSGHIELPSAHLVLLRRPGELEAMATA